MPGPAQDIGIRGLAVGGPMNEGVRGSHDLRVLREERIRKKTQVNSARTAPQFPS